MSVGDRTLDEALEAGLSELTSPGRWALASVCVLGDRSGFWLSGADRGSAFHLGSVTKTLTALLLATTAVQGRLDLDDPLDRYLDAATGSGIRLVDLATHRSGLPRLPADLMVRMLRRLSDPYSCLSDQIVDRALARLSRHQRGPSHAFGYSNFGFGVLGRALAVAGGAPFVELTRHEVLSPLGLDTTTADMAEDPARVPGHSSSGRVVSNWHNPTLAGCGCFWSTIDDLHLYLQANLYPERTSLADALALVHQPRREAGRTRHVGLGWFMTDTDDGVVHWHNGGTSGFGTFIGLNPERRTGIGLMISRAHSSDIDRTAMKVLSGLR